MHWTIAMATVVGWVACGGTAAKAPGGKASPKPTSSALSQMPLDLADLCRAELAEDHCSELSEDPKPDPEVVAFCTCQLVQGMRVAPSAGAFTGAALMKARTDNETDADYAFGLALRHARGGWQWASRLFTEDRLRPNAPTEWEDASLSIKSIVPGQGPSIVVRYAMLESDTRDETTTTDKTLVCDGQVAGVPCWEFGTTLVDQHCMLDCDMAGKAGGPGDDCMVCKTETSVMRLEFVGGKVRTHHSTTVVDYHGRTTRPPADVTEFPSLKALIEANAEP